MPSKPKMPIKTDCFNLYKKQLADYETQQFVLNELNKNLGSLINKRSRLKNEQVGDSRTGGILSLPCKIMTFDSENLDYILLTLSSIKK